VRKVRGTRACREDPGDGGECGTDARRPCLWVNLAPGRSPEFFNLRSHPGSSRLLRWDTGRNSSIFYPLERPRYRGFLFRVVAAVELLASRSQASGRLGKQVRNGSSYQVELESGRLHWAHFSESTQPGLKPSHPRSVGTAAGIRYGFFRRAQKNY
jgi:hypothetical protein